MPVVIVFGLIAIVALAFGLRHLRKKRRIKDLLASRLTEHERQILHDQIPLLRKLPADLHGQLEGKIILFLDQVDMHGCEGLDITKEMTLSIAGQACLLIVNSDQWYQTLRTVLVYPAAFKSVQARHDGFVVREEEVVRLGESWAHGPVILSWEASHQGAQNDQDGHNVVLHEFAHQLDGLSGNVNAVPILNRRQSFAEWERVFLEAYERHQKNVDRNAKTVLDAYGATNHQEFLAVAVEVFFEKPVPLREVEADLYEQLSFLLKLDPATWTVEPVM